MHVGLLIIPGFGLLGLAACMEVMFQFAERLPRGQLSWEIVARDPDRVVALNGASVQPDRSIDHEAKYHCIIAFGARGAATYDDRKVLGWLRYHARHGARMGSVMSGAWLLARAGLLNGCRCSIHWQEIEAFREDYPEVVTSADIYVDDGQRFSCAGGHAAADMMLHVLSQWFDPVHATAVREALLHERLRQPNEMQRLSLNERTGVRNPYVLRVVEQMETCTDSPRPIGAICASVGLSQRRVEQLFREHFGKTPLQCQLEIRLRRARDLLAATTLSIREIALMTGFRNPSHFASVFAKQFGVSPSGVRKT